MRAAATAAATSRRALRDPWALAAAVVLVLLLAAVFVGGWIASELTGLDARSIEFKAIHLAPWSRGGGHFHLLGTDLLGRDLLVRLLDGGRWSLGIPLGAVTAGFAAGAPLGIASRRRPVLLAAATLPGIYWFTELLVPLPLGYDLFGFGWQRGFALLALAATTAAAWTARRDAAPVALAGAGCVVAAAAVLAGSRLYDFVDPPTPSWNALLDQAIDPAGGWWFALFPALAVGLAVGSLLLLGLRLRWAAAGSRDTLGRSRAAQ